MDLRIVGCSVLLAVIAYAEEPTSQPSRDDLARLAAENARLSEEVAQLRDDHDYLEQVVNKLLPLQGRISGYVDFGAFDVQGRDGSGLRIDTDHRLFPEYAYVPDGWVFLGDPLSVAVNSRGEPADTGGSRAVVFDSIDSNGHPSFILNNINMTVFAGIGDNLQLNAVVDFVPRRRDISDIGGVFMGDYIDVKLAYAEYRVPAKSLALSLFAGKFDSVVGLEYRSQESPDRMTVTPSLICRYTCGHPLGVKARLTFGLLTLNTSLTNGSHFVELWPFSNEIDTNDGKTIAGRLSAHFDVGSGLELGVSGAYGAQDLQNDDSIKQHHLGADLHLDWNDIDLQAEYVRGEAPGKDEPAHPDLPCAAAPCLTYQGAYGLVGYRLQNWLMPYVRVDWRDALHKKGADFVYVSQVMRTTAGARVELGTNVIVKAEFTRNVELGPLKPFDDDVVTSSLVIKY